MQGLMIQDRVDYSQLKDITVPDETRTYKPIAYKDYVDTLLEVGGKTIENDGFTLHDSEYGFAQKGQQLFGIHTYKNGSNDIGMSIGFRTSYDKSLSNTVAIGGSVFVCANLMIQGNIMVMRKHTPNVIADMEVMLEDAFVQAPVNFDTALETKEKYVTKNLNTDDGYRMLGYLYGHGILSPRQLTTAKNEWTNPTHSQHGNNTVWTCYNACTEALKTAPYYEILEKYKKLDSAFWESEANA